MAWRNKIGIADDVTRLSLKWDESFDSEAQGVTRAVFEGLLDDIDVLVADASRRTSTLNAYVSGFGATRRIVAQPDLAAVKGVILPTFELDEYVAEALRSGASGFLVKDTEPVDLLRAVRVVADGEALLSPSVTRRLIADYVSRTAPRAEVPGLEALTEREREVMALVAGGLSNAEIAAHLVVSPATARTHVSRAMVKLHARDRAQLVVFAYESGLVRPGAADS